MNTLAHTAQIETAVRTVLWLLRDSCGQVPYITRSSWRVAVRLLRLEANSGTSWRATCAPGTIEAYLEAAGFDNSGWIVDYEKFYAYLEAHKKAKGQRS